MPALKARVSPRHGPTHRPINVDHSALQWTWSGCIRMFNKHIGVVMKAKSLAALLVASSASLAAPAFAGGDGQSSFYRTDVGAPVSQRGHAAQTKAVARAHGSSVGGTRSGVGGEESVKPQSGRRAPTDSIDPMYRGG